jgi:hypothetical protein
MRNNMNPSQKAAEAKKAENNAKTKQYIERKKLQEKKNKEFLQGNSATPQSSRADPNYNGPAPGNKVSINKAFEKRNRMGRLINSKTGLPYPGQ